MKINEFDKEVTQKELDILEMYIDKVFNKIGIDVEFTRHFLDRVNDERNKQQITIKELGKLFAKEYKRWGKPIAQMGPDQEAVMKDLESDINIPFALRWDRENNELDLIAKTVMRKPNFKTSNKEFPVESITEQGILWWNWYSKQPKRLKPTAEKKYKKHLELFKRAQQGLEKYEKGSEPYIRSQIALKHHKQEMDNMLNDRPLLKKFVGENLPPHEESVELKENAMSAALDLWNIISSLKSAGWSYEAMFFLAGFTIAPGSIPAIIELWNREDDRIKIDRVKAIIKRLKDGSANKDDIEALDDYGKYLVQWLGGGEYRPDGKYNTYGRKRNEINSISYSMWMHIDAVARWAYRKLTGKEVRKIKIAKSNVPQVKKESINEEFGSVPPLAELILMAVVAKTSVDVLLGMFKVAFKTGKGLKKLNDLRKRVTKMGQDVADYAMPYESVNEATKEEIIARIADDQKKRFYKAALDAMHRLVTSKGGKQSIGGYAFDIARAFSGINAKDLEKMYNEIH